jgi:RecJ-like exonuclease
MSKPTIFISHGDLDGMSATAVIADTIRKKRPETRLIFLFSQPHELDKTLIQVPEEFEELYLVDIAIDTELWPKLSLLLYDISKRGKIIWLDHHPSTLSFSDKLTKIGIQTILENTRSAASIARKFLQNTSDPSFYESIIKLGEASDLAIKLEKDDPLHHSLETLSIALAYKTREEQLRKKILSSWLNKKIIVPDEAAEAAQEGEKIYRELYQEAKQNIIFESDNLLIADLRNRRVYGFIGRIASVLAGEKEKPVILLTRLGETATLITYRAPAKNSYEKMSKIVADIARSYGGGGGHLAAFSYKVPSAYMENILKELIDAANSL